MNFKTIKATITAKTLRRDKSSMICPSVKEATAAIEESEKNFERKAGSKILGKIQSRLMNLSEV